MGAAASVPSESKMRRVAYIRIFNAARQNGLSIRGFCEQALNDTDSDKDGYLTKQEFLQASSKLGFTSTADASVEAIFESLKAKQDPVADQLADALSMNSFVNFLLQARASGQVSASSPKARPDKEEPKKRRRRPSMVVVETDDGIEKVVEENTPQDPDRKRVTKKRPSVVGIVNDSGQEEVKEVGDLSAISYSSPTKEENAKDEDSFKAILGVNRVQNLRRCSLLGIGMFGSVKLVQDARTGTPYALKTLSKAKIVENKQEKNVLAEKAIMQSLSHPFMVKLITTAQDKNSLYMVLDLVQGGELFNLLHGNGDRCLPTPQAYFYAACVILVFEYLHERNWLYRDLKPENLLIDRSGYIKVVDFGFAKQLPSADSTTKTFLGTPEYMAPELVAREGYNKSVDYWALGCLIFEMVSGNVPYCMDDEQTQKEMYELIAAGVPVYFPDEFGEDVRAHVDCTEPKRANFIEKLYSKELVSGLLHKNVSKRLGCTEEGIAELKGHDSFKDINWEDMLERKVVPPWTPALENELDMSHFEEYDPAEEGPRVEFSGDHAAFDNF